MAKLSDTQLVILSAASQREDGAVLPLTIDLKGGAVQKVLASLGTKGLIGRTGAPRGDEAPPLRITRAGLEAIGVEPAPDTDEAPFVEVTDAPGRPTCAGAGAGGPEGSRLRGRSCSPPSRRTSGHEAGNDDRPPEAA